MPMRPLLVACAFAALLAPSASAQYDSPLFPSLESPTEEPQDYSDMILVDLDGDGRKDAALGPDFAGVAVALADATGGFAPVRIQVTGDVGSRLAAGDVDQDGDMDLAWTSDAVFFGGAYGVLVNDGAAAFDREVLSFSQYVDDLVLGDLTGDGDGDLVLMSIGFDEVRVLLGGAGTSFGVPTTFNTGDVPAALRLGDVDGDGDLDVAVARKGGAAVLVNDGAGALGPPRVLQVGGQGVDLELLHLDQDGVLDIVVATGNLPVGALNGWISSALGVGDGTFGPATTLEIGQVPTQVQAADWDGDGFVDPVVSTEQGLLWMFDGDGSGTLPTPRYRFVPGLLGRLAVDDRNGDGFPELLQAHPYDLLEYRNDGTGEMLMARVTLQPGLNAFSLGSTAVGDVHGDGHADVVSLLENAGLAVYAGDGTAALAEAVTWRVGQDTVEVVLGDMDQDGDLDAVLSEQGVSRLVVALNDGAGGFGTWSTKNLGVPGVGDSLVAADVTGDGLLDIALLVDEEPVIAPGDGAGGFDPVTTIALTSHGADRLRVADLEGDGDLDLVAGGSGFPGDADVHLILATAPGVFAIPQLIQPWAGGIEDLDLGDVDGDGVLDLVSLEPNSDLVLVQAGDGLGGFAPSVEYPLPDLSRGLAADGSVELADLNGDGVDDLLLRFGSIFNELVHVVLGQAGVGLGPLELIDGTGFSRDVTAGDLTGDGHPELIVPSFVGPRLSVYRNLGPSPWERLPGGGIKGSGGSTPLLDGSGTLEDDSALRVTLSRARASTMMTLVLGVERLGAPFKGGVLEPDPLLLLAFTTDVHGFVEIDTVWPAGIPSGFATWMQAWLPDAAAVKGFSASEGLKATTP
jgi:hypothetical protein